LSRAPSDSPGPGARTISLAVEIRPDNVEERPLLIVECQNVTSMAISRDPSALIAELNDIFSAFDRIAGLFGCERIKTIGPLVGIQRYVYDIFGPAVNLAAMMEAVGEAMQTALAEDTYKLIWDEFVCVERGEFDVKGSARCSIYTPGGRGRAAALIRPAAWRAARFLPNRGRAGRVPRRRGSRTNGRSETA
jgi:hypothetical protein